MSDSFLCPHCNKQTRTRVIDSRAATNGTVIRRRRVCGKCGQRFTTHEISAHPIKTAAKIIVDLLAEVRTERDSL